MEGPQKRIMVDMSATLIHHGHIRLLKAAKKLGFVVVALTRDADVREKKGYDPELNYEARQEILAALRYVDQVVPSPWLIDEAFLDAHDIDLLVHGADNKNPISAERILILPRTAGISTTLLRERVLHIVSKTAAVEDEPE